MKYPKRLLFMTLSDVIIISLSVFLSYFVRFEFVLVPPYDQFIVYTMAGHIFFLITVLFLTHMYRPIFKFASSLELIGIVKAAIIAEILFWICNLLIQSLHIKLLIPRSIYVLSLTFMIVGIGGSRFIWKVITSSTSKIKPDQHKVLIIGAGSAGVLVVKELRQSPASHMSPVAFIDDDVAKQKLHVYGLPVVGTREDIPKIVREYEIQDIIIAMPSVSKEDMTNIITLCNKTKASVKILPCMSDILSGKVSVEMIREVKIEDLLGREPVRVDLDEISQYIHGEVILVTGAGGSIGSELCRQISKFGPKIVLLLGHGENSIFEIHMELRQTFPNLPLECIIADIKDKHHMEEIFRIYQPSVVFHAAAHKHVPLMEQNPIEAIKNNVLGTKHVAECAHKFGVSRFVLISTDKAVNPTSIMGATKRIAEMLIQGLNRQSKTKFVAVRFGNVLGSRGSVIPIFKRQIQQGGPITITHPDMVRYFMTIPEAAQLVIQAGALAEGGEIFVLDMGEPVKISLLAQDLIRLSGLEPEKDIRIVYTGIRPGEKLFEELLTNEEITASTRHNRIYIGKPLDFSWNVLLASISKLETIVMSHQKQSLRREIIEILHSMIPTYQYHRDWPMESVEQSTPYQSSNHALGTLIFNKAKVEIPSN